MLYLIVCWPTATLIDRLEKRLNTIPPPRNERSGPRQWRIGRFKLRGDRA